MSAVSDAVAKALATHTFGEGMCDAFSAYVYGFSASGYNSAADHWSAVPAQYKHPGDTKPPKGSIAMFVGGTHGFGHAAPVVTNTSDMHSTDMSPTGTYAPGQVNTVPLAAVRNWYPVGSPVALKYVGWIDPYFEGRLVTTIAKETTVLTLVDASTNRPTPAAVKAAGHAGIIGYVSDFPAKNITKAECAAFIAAGLSVSLVWENGSQDAYGGYAAGVAAGQKASAQAAALGCPKGVVLFAAADSNAATAATVGAYFQGWAQAVKAAGFLDGAYGDAAASHLCTYSWKVETWGTGDANIVQMVNAPIGPMPGTDTDEILHDFPRWDAGFVARAAAQLAPAVITQTMRELVMEIHNTPASNEWGRRARIAYNLLRGLPGAAVGHVTTAEPAHIANARTDLHDYIPGTNPADQWGKRARLAYNALRGIN